MSVESVGNKMFRILITGSRTWDDYNTIAKAISDTIVAYAEEHPHLKSGPLDWVSIVHGNCPNGADKLADIFASKVLRCKVERYDADWATFQKRAGFVRNRRMVDSLPDACLAFIREKSKGATMCRDLAKAKGISTETYIYEENNDNFLR
jgi:hypothetical protein